MVTFASLLLVCATVTGGCKGRTSPPGQPGNAAQEEAVEKLKTDLRQRVQSRAPERAHYGKDHLKYRRNMVMWNNNVIAALSKLSQFKDPKDLPLLWAHLGRRRLQEDVRLDQRYIIRRRTEEPPVAKIMATYGSAAQTYIIEEITSGRTDKWTRDDHRTRLRAALCVLGAVGSADSGFKVLADEAKKQKGRKRTRLLSFSKKAWGSPSEEKTPRQ
jgi:hypothetical protein